MLKKQLFIIGFLFTHALYAQDYTGVWEGWFSTDMIPQLGRRTFFMHLEIQQQDRNLIGMFYNTMPDARDRPSVIYTISGKLGKQDRKIFRLTKNEILEDYLAAGVASVFNDFHCRYKLTDTAEILQGVWYPNGQASPRFDGAGGPFIVKRISQKPSMSAAEIFSYMQPKPKLKEEAKKKEELAPPVKTYAERKDSVFAQLTTPINTATLFIYDNAVIDGDIVSVYVNDSLILSHQKLAAKPITYHLKLEKSKQYKITLLAENLGSIPPNTAYVYVQFSDKLGKQVYLSCTEQQNASVVITLKED